ncbi:hypothetical protein OROGR_014317 [Orobanche gracilis]
MQVVDSMVVERARGESQSVSGLLQSLCWGSSALGGIISSYFSGSFVGAYGVSVCLWINSFASLNNLCGCSSCERAALSGSARGHNILSDSNSLSGSSKNSIMQLWDAVKQPNYDTNKLGFTPEFLGRVKLVTSVASLVGVGLYNGFLKSVRLRKIFLVTTIIGSALGMTQVLLVTGLNRKFGIDDEWFAIGDSLIITVLGQVSFMPVLVLAAKLCPEDMEATLFATVYLKTSAVVSLGAIRLETVSTTRDVIVLRKDLDRLGFPLLVTIQSDKFDNLTFLIILCNLSSLLPLPLLGLLPEDTADVDGDIEMKSN